MSITMREAALKYYERNYNCSQCIIKAAEEVYGLEIPPQCYDMCQGLSNGLGIGSTCVAVEAGLFVFGLLFDTQTCLRLRMKLITIIQTKWRTVYCQKLKGKLKTNERDCSRVIGSVSEIIGNLIDDEMKRQKKPLKNR